MSKSAIVIGVGPLNGLGGQLARRFAKELHVYIAGRTMATLEEVAGQIREEGGQVTPIATDARDPASIDALFANVADEDLELAIYNVGNNTPGAIKDMDPGYFEYSWRTCCFGGFLFAKAAINKMAGKGGVLLFTGASASMRGRAGFGAFNSSKGALRNLAQALAKECAEDGIHVGHVVVDGPIGGDKIIKGLPDFARAKGERGMISLEGIVDIYEMLYRQPRNAWSFEADVRTSEESW